MNVDVPDGVSGVGFNEDCDCIDIICHFIVYYKMNEKLYLVIQNDECPRASITGCLIDCLNLGNELFNPETA